MKWFLEFDEFLSEVTIISCMMVCLLGNLGCADIISLFLFRIFSSLFEKQVIKSIQRFHISSLMLILRLLTFVQCCSDF